MRPLTVDDVRPPSRYEPVRADARRQVIELKRPRRVSVGPLLTLVFENRETVRAVIEELLRAERIEERARIAEEVEVFNALIPGENELSATLFIELTDPADLGPRLGELRGIEDHVRLELGGESVLAEPEPGRSRDDRTASVHYLRFRVTPEQHATLLGEGEAELVVDHSAYRARAVLDDAQRAALGADLASDDGGPRSGAVGR